jgi:plastocyanin
MADWLVNIVTGASGDAEFVVGLPGAQQGQPLQADQDDLVTWNNETDDEHQPWQTDEDYEPVETSDLSDLIKPGQSSDNYDCAQPSGSPPQWTIYYYCNRHPDNPKERGSIQVAALPQSMVNITGTGASTAFAPQSLTVKAPGGLPIGWFNSTNQPHQPWQTDQNYQPLAQSQLAGVIQPDTPSLVYTPPSPASGASSTIYYYCKLHPKAQNERGTIVVTSS